MNNYKSNEEYGVIYARYSSHKQNDESIEQQVSECTAYAEENHIRIVKVYDDHAVSGRSDSRLAFQRMLRDAARREFSVVIAYKSNRIGRNMLQAHPVGNGREKQEKRRQRRRGQRQIKSRPFRGGTVIW